MKVTMKPLVAAITAGALIAPLAIADTKSPSMQDRLDKPHEAGELSYGEKATSGYRDNATIPVSNEVDMLGVSEWPEKSERNFASDRPAAGAEQPVGGPSNVGYTADDAPDTRDGDGVADAVDNMESEKDSYGISG